MGFSTGSYISHTVDLRKDGSTFYAEVHGSSYTLDDEQLLLAVIRDITEQKQSQDLILMEKEKAQKYLDIAEVIMLALNKKGEITLINQKGNQVLGYEKDELIGRNWFDTCLVKQMIKERKQFFRKLMAGETELVEFYENPVLTKSGEEKIVAWHSTIVRDEKGRSIGALSSGEDITERRQAEHSLHQFKHIVSSSTDMLALLDKQFKYLTVNMAYSEAFNLTPEQLIGNTVDEVFGEEFFNAVIKPNADRCLGGEEVSYQDWFDFPTHGRRYMNVTYYPYYGEDNKIMGFVVNGRNITERKRAQAELIRNEARYHGLFDNSPIPIWEEDFSEVYEYFDELEKDGIIDFEQYWAENPDEFFKCAGMIKVIDVNIAAVRLFKAKSKDDLKRSIGDVFAEETLPMFKKSLLAIASQKKTFESEVVLRTLKNEKIEVMLKWSILGDRVIASTQDITEQKQSQNVLRIEKEKAQKYLDIAGVIMLALNEKGEITLINQKGNRVLSYQEGELIGKSWFEACVPERIRKEIRQVFRKLMAGDIEPVEFYQNPVLTKSGEERIIAWHNIILRNEKGHNIGTLSSGEDITEQVRAEQLLKALNQAVVTMGTALTQRDIFKAVAEELKQLDITCILFPVDETQGKLITKYLGYNPAILKAAEKLVGIKHEDFSFPIDTVDLYREVVSEKKTLFTDNLGQAFQQIIPKPAKKLLPKIINLLRIWKSILAPLIVEDLVIGVFSVQSDNLTRKDVPAITAFANELAGAWNKTKLVQDLRKTVEGTIHTIAATVEARDPYTAGHQTRVADLAVAIATEMDLSDNQIEGIHMTGIIHDLGKIKVPAEILSKPGIISGLEYDMIKIHPKVGFDLLKDIEFPWPIAEMVL